MNQQQPEKKRGLLGWIKVILIAVGAIAVLYILAVWVMLSAFMIREPQPTPFDQRVWHNPERDDQARHAMLADLIEKHKLVGMTRQEIESLLGKSEWPGREWHKLGPQSGFGIDDIWLELTYKNEKVIKHEIKYD